MKSPVANCSVMYATSTFLIVLIYNIPPIKSVTNENIKRAHYRIVSYVNDECVPAIKSQIYHGWEKDRFMSSPITFIQGTKLPPDEI